MPYRSVTSAEICCHNSTCWHGQLYPLSAKLRALLGPAAILCERTAGAAPRALRARDLLRPPPYMLRLLRPAAPVLFAKDAMLLC